ncbi:50S ribosomal protein L29 [Candidatus Daviesbacteria bacterium]|nr:50S ribosomal protein L29 [Candidatus Daviesbacteria bacterium]
MKKRELTQIKSLPVKELILKAKAIKGEIANLVIDKNIKKLKDTRSIFKKRKDLAQVLTIIRQKQLLEKLESRVESQESSKEVSKAETRKEKTSL